MIISNRSIITVFYEYEKEDGTKVVIHSSQGNDEIAASCSLVGWNVIANNVCTETAYKPCEDGIGVEITMLVSMDPCGMIPGFLKNKIAARIGNAALVMGDYLRDGKVPEPIFWKSNSTYTLKVEGSTTEQI